MKTIKINFKYFCEGFDPENNFFTNLLRRKYKVIISENPDYLFYSVYNTKAPPKFITKIGLLIKNISPQSYIHARKIFSNLYSKFAKQKKIKENKIVKIFYGSEHVKPNMEECDWAFSSFFEEEISSNKHLEYLCIL